MTIMDNRVPAAGDLPVPPAWLDLDAIVPPELRARIAQQTDAGRVLAEAVRAWAIESFRTMSDYDEAVKAATANWSGDIGDDLGELTGYERLFAVTASMVDDLEAVKGEVDKPEWVLT